MNNQLDLNLVPKIVKRKDFLGHPPGLFVLFFTEMWERFSYYGMRALLVLYMTKYLFKATESGLHVWGYDFTLKMLGFLFGPMTAQALSSQIYGIYTGLVYFTPFFGGILADQWIGQRRSVYVGGALMTIGHFLMAVESAFFPALFFLILGNGFFKPNISTQVGSLYEEGDPRIDRAFSIFYMGINLGAFFSPLICGTLGEKVGWHWGFGAAGVGMILGVIIYHFGRGYLPPEKLTKKVHAQKNDQSSLSATDKTSGSQSAKKSNSLTRDEWERVVALLLLAVVTIAFWGVYEQQGNTLQLWADSKTDRNILGFEIPSTWIQSLNPLLIFIFVPLLNKFWSWQSIKGKEPRTTTKMAIGCIFAAAAFFVMSMGANAIGPNEKGNIMWLVGCIYLLTMGEIYLSPTGLSLANRLAPAKIASMMMGFWLMSSFFGNYLAGYLGTFYETMGQANFLMAMGGLAGITGVVFALFSIPLRRLVP